MKLEEAAAAPALQLQLLQLSPRPPGRPFPFLSPTPHLDALHFKRSLTLSPALPAGRKQSRTPGEAHALLVCPSLHPGYLNKGGAVRNQVEAEKKL
jgi:hypothetical protein